MSGALRAWVPRWWRGEGGAGGWLLDRLLWPAEQMYRGVVRVRNHAYEAGWASSASSPLPVLSIGNLAVGGAGKTPLAAWVARRLLDSGLRPAIVLRGYGEDEILVHRELNPHVPVIAAPRRLDGARAAAEAGRDVVVLDDGFQHRSLARDLDIVLVATESWSPDPRMLPRGPWREGLASLRRAHVVLVTRKTAPLADAEQVAAAVANLAPGVQVAVCHLEPTGLAPLHADNGVVPLRFLAGHQVLAVASLADPLPFEQQLREAGAQPELLAYPDHHRFTAADAREIVRRAAGRPIVLTRKEAVKLRGLLAPDLSVLVLQQSVVVETGEAPLVETLVRAATHRSGGAHPRSTPS